MLLSGSKNFSCSMAEASQFALSGKYSSSGLSSCCIKDDTAIFFVLATEFCLGVMRLDDGVFPRIELVLK